MPEERGLYPKMAVRRQLAYLARLHGADAGAAGSAADALLEELGLAPRAADRVEQLSLGNQQRVQLAAALVHGPGLLVLDEPFSGLDPVAVDTLGEILAELVTEGTALVLSSHQLDLVADVCSTVVIIDHGQVVLRGDVADLRAASTTRYLEVEFAQPTSWKPSSGVDVSVDEGERRYRATLAAGSDARDLLAEALSLGEVTGYSFAPPDLSEVFLGVVGRTTIEDAEDAGPAEPAGSTGPARAEGASA
jgi:ABC-2 type transport system ATP-binding protein